MGQLDGKVALITGAATGIQGEVMGFGGATAWLFAKEGAKVVLADIQEDLGHQSASQIRNTGADAMFIRLDVTKESDWISAIESIVSEYGKLDVLFNNAGGGIPTNGYSPHTLLDTTLEQWNYVMSINATGTFLGTKHGVIQMKKTGGGSIINMSSIHGIVGTPRQIAYSAAKAAIRNFTKAVAVSHANDGIRINSIHPGNSLTSRVAERFPDGDYPTSWTSRVPSGRLGTALEVAHGALYLASDNSSYTTGTELVIDGGFLAY